MDHLVALGILDGDESPDEQAPEDEANFQRPRKRKRRKNEDEERFTRPYNLLKRAAFKKSMDALVLLVRNKLRRRQYEQAAAVLAVCLRFFNVYPEEFFKCSVKTLKEMPLSADQLVRFYRRVLNWQNGAIETKEQVHLELSFLYLQRGNWEHAYENTVSGLTGKTFIDVDMGLSAHVHGYTGIISSGMAVRLLKQIVDTAENDADSSERAVATKQEMIMTDLNSKTFLLDRLWQRYKSVRSRALQELQKAMSKDPTCFCYLYYYIKVLLELPASQTSEDNVLDSDGDMSSSNELGRRYSMSSTVSCGSLQDSKLDTSVEVEDEEDEVIMRIASNPELLEEIPELPAFQNCKHMLNELDLGDLEVGEVHSS